MLFELAAIVAPFLIYLLIVIFDYVNWNCLVDNHSYIYVGQCHGMTLNGKGGVKGTQRNMYKCCACDKDRPIVDKDYC